MVGQAALVMRAAWLEVEQVKGRKWIEALFERVVFSWMREAYRDEIERAINNIKPRRPPR